MLRARTRGRTLAANAVLSLSHGLGIIPTRFWCVSFGGGRGAGRHYVTAVGTNRICVANSAVSTCTVDVFTIVDHAAGARLY
jgi:hypothetical protein